MTKPNGSTRLHVVPLELSEANRLVDLWHRHHHPSQGHRFSLGVMDRDGVLRGACIIGRPVARLAGSPRDVLEVVRLVSDGTPNACSILYAAAARAGAAMGYRRIQTYILDDEPGVTLTAAGWTNEGEAGGGQWKHTDGKARRTDQPVGLKERWAKSLAVRPDLAALPEHVDALAGQESLFAPEAPMTDHDARLDHVMHAIAQPGPVDDDPRDYEPDGYPQAELDQLADEEADRDYDRRNR